MFDSVGPYKCLQDRRAAYSIRRYIQSALRTPEMEQERAAKETGVLPARPATPRHLQQYYKYLKWFNIGTSEIEGNTLGSNKCVAVGPGAVEVVVVEVVEVLAEVVLRVEEVVLPVVFVSVESAVFSSTAETTAPGEEVRIRLAGLLPGLARWSNLALNGVPNELVDNILDVRQVAALSAIVFGRFEERFQ
ncbi:hypothetical protein B0H16DRAFT_1795429 [Mycena metata]|uniref:Uncharacterized protein n=1 Tax=Mycena metata TaxID=1033252 RepID=A0AAD7MJE3_9AGAR|nr:hypothetical protein B0H16DRAFT_1795429 [Mycena metata]